VRENYRAADHLVGVARVHAQTHRQIDGLVELGVLDLLEEIDCIRQRIHRLGDSGARLRNILASCHASLVSHRFASPSLTGALAHEAHAQKPWCN
jgi:uncharacterized membrane protein